MTRFLVWFFAFALFTVVSAVQAGQVVSFYGDSHTSGHFNQGTPSANVLVRLVPTPVERVAAYADLTGHDYGTPGESAGSFVLRSDNSTVAVLRYGVADAIYKTRPMVFRLAMLNAITKLKAMNKRVIIVGLPRLYAGVWWTNQAFADRVSAYNSVLESAAARLGLEFIDVRALESTPADIADGVHPSAAYADRIAYLIAFHLGDTTD